MARKEHNYAQLALVRPRSFNHKIIRWNSNPLFPKSRMNLDERQSAVFTSLICRGQEYMYLDYPFILSKIDLGQYKMEQQTPIPSK